jgi:hypothetical protein
VQTLNHPLPIIFITSQVGGWGVPSEINERDGHSPHREASDATPRSWGKDTQKGIEDKKNRGGRDRDTNVEGKNLNTGAGEKENSLVQGKEKCISDRYFLKTC